MVERRIHEKSNILQLSGLPFNSASFEFSRRGLHFLDWPSGLTPWLMLVDHYKVQIFRIGNRKAATR
jgi:hypothetical protein